jgi:hypothetical protein
MRKLTLTDALLTVALLFSAAATFAQNYPTVIFPQSAPTWYISGGAGGSFNSYCTPINTHFPTPRAGDSGVPCTIQGPKTQVYGFTFIQAYYGGSSCSLSSNYVNFPTAGQYRLDVQYMGGEGYYAATGQHYYPVLTLYLDGVAQTIYQYPTGNSHSSTTSLVVDNGGYELPSHDPGLLQYASYLISIPSAGNHNLNFTVSAGSLFSMLDTKPRFQYAALQDVSAAPAEVSIGQIAYYPNTGSVKVTEQSITANYVKTFSDLMTAARSWVTASGKWIELDAATELSNGACSNGQCDRLAIQ